MKKYFPILIGLCAAVIATIHLGSGLWLAHDLSWPLEGARVLRAGGNPYTVLLFPDRGPLFSDPLYYPMPAVLVALPLSYLPNLTAGVLWSSLCATLLALVTPRHRWPMFLSAAFFVNAQACTWIMLLMAAYEIPALSGVFACKPTVGAALWTSKPNKAAIVGGVVLLALSLLILPSWPLDWLHNAALSHHPIPLLVCPALGLLILRWRDRDARYVFLLSLAPQILYLGEPLLLFRACKGWKSSMALAALTWVVWGAVQLWGESLRSGFNFPFSVWLLYLPVALYTCSQPIHIRMRNARGIAGAAEADIRNS